jgi:protein-S-isoprenylcysteine O-methyltransferase Ste14
VYFLFRFLRDGGSPRRGNWVFVDCLLALQFAVVHSILLLPSVKKSITRTLPNELYGTLFAAATCAGSWLIFGYWRNDPATVWSADGWSKTFVIAGFYCSWAALFYSLSLSGFGYQTGWTQWLFWLRRMPLVRRGLVQRGPYRWLRHPVYMSFLGLIWFTPRMTADHALLTAVWTVYIFVGSYLKDRRLQFYLGDTYREYANRVPGFPGMFFGPLGKWKRREPSFTADRSTPNIPLTRAA